MSERPRGGYPAEQREVEARRAIEAVLMAATEPIEARMLAELVELPVSRIEELCSVLGAEYERDGRGFALVFVAGGYRYQTHPDLAPYVERFVLEGRHARLSPPALETLAIVAYKQPVSRAQLSAIRGVNVEATLRTLLERGYIAEVGRDSGPGNAVLYGTTDEFLARVGLGSLADLPGLGDFVPGPEVLQALEQGLRVTRSDAPTLDAPALDAPSLEARSSDGFEGSSSPS